MKEYVYTLILEKRLFVEDNWTEKDEAIISRHVMHLMSLEKKGILIMAGKTSNLDVNTKGFVFFQAESFEKASTIMKSDPAIIEGIMTATLQEYDVALFNNKYKK